jgi:hypothetical protein
MLDAQSLRSCRPWLGLTLVAALAACSSDKPAAPEEVAAAASSDASSDEIRWFDQRRGIEVVMDDGDMEWINHTTGKSYEFEYVIDPSGDMVVMDEDKALSAEGEFRLRNEYEQWRGAGVDVRLDAISDTDALDDVIDELTEKREARWANRPSSPDGYRLIDQNDLRWVLASRMADRLTDENLAQVFIEDFSSGLDAFAKKDLMDQHLPQVKATLADWAKIQDFRMEAISDKALYPGDPANGPAILMLPTSPLVLSYDTKTEGFTGMISFGPCESDGTQTNFEAAGANYTFRYWAKPGEPACLIKPHSEEQARAMEAARAANTLKAHSAVYFRFPGEQKNRAFVMDVHRVDLTFSAVRFDRSVAKYVVEPLGPTITLTEPRP